MFKLLVKYSCIWPCEQTSTLSSGSSQVTVRSSSGSGGGSPSSLGGQSSVPTVLREAVVEQQLRELREEQRRLQEEAIRLAQERRQFEVIFSNFCLGLKLYVNLTFYFFHQFRIFKLVY